MHDAHQRPRARVRVQPADRLLVPPARRRAGLRGRRGAQHLRRAARLPAPPGRAGPREAAKEFYVSPFFPVDGRYRHAPARPDGDAAARQPERAASTGQDERAFAASVRGRGRAGHPAGAARQPPSGTRGPPPPVSARIRWQGVRLYLRGLPVDPAARTPVPGGRPVTTTASPRPETLDPGRSARRGARPGLARAARPCARCPVRHGGRRLPVRVVLPDGSAARRRRTGRPGHAPAPAPRSSSTGSAPPA